MKPSCATASLPLRPPASGAFFALASTPAPMPHPAGDNDDFASLYHATISPLRRYLARLLGNPAEAEDVAHDAYLRVWPKIENHEADKPEALLYTTARNLAFNRLNRRRIAPFIAAEADLDHAASRSPGVVRQVMARQEWDRLQAAIAALPAGCRQVLLLRKIELLPHKDIAARLGIAVSTVEKQHARALRLLRAAVCAETDASDASEAPPWQTPESRP